MSGPGAQEDFIPLEDAFYRMARHLREFAWTEFMGEYIQFSAKTAADHRFDDPHLTFRHAQAPGDPVPADIGALGRCPDGPFAVFIFRHRSMGFNRRVNHFLGLIVMPIRIIGFREGFFRISGFHHGKDGQVAAVRIVNGRSARL